MRNLLAVAATMVAFPVNANIWNSSSADGILMATVTTETDEIAVLCDVGINAPITSINFVVQDNAPAPFTNVALFFDKDAPIYIGTDSEGAIGSITPKEAADFNKILDLIKVKSNLKVRLFNGATQTFKLSGSSDALGECRADFSNVEIAQNF